MNERTTPGRQAVRDTTRDVDTTGDVVTTADVDTGQATDIREQDDGFLPDDRMNALRSRWDDVQAGFVDDPRNAVQQAHQLVTQLVNELTDVFTRERSTLEGQWSGGGQPDTETLRVALQRYRIFFNRLLST